MRKKYPSTPDLATFFSTEYDIPLFTPIPIMEAYKQLNDKCDKVMDKIRLRRIKNGNKNGHR